MKLTVTYWLMLSWAALIGIVAVLNAAAGAALAVVVLAAITRFAVQRQADTTWDARIELLELSLQAKLDAQNAALTALVDKFTQLRADEAVARAQFTQVPRLRG